MMTLIIKVSVSLCVTVCVLVCTCDVHVYLSVCLRVRVSLLCARVMKVHFVTEPDMRLPTKKERQDRSRGVRLTNLEKCLVCKMFITTGMTFTKLADLWGCTQSTIASAVHYWDDRWRQASQKYSRLLVFPEYLKECQPAGWSRRYKRPISHMTDGSVVASDTPRKCSPLGRLMFNSKV